MSSLPSLTLIGSGQLIAAFVVVLSATDLTVVRFETGGVALVGLIGGWMCSDDLSIAIGVGLPLKLVEWWVKFAERRFKALPAANEKIAEKRARALEEWELSRIGDDRSDRPVKRERLHPLLCSCERDHEMPMSANRC
ncbi:MAG: hypothetical protein U0791_04270 [Gemmataceae bacterium]